MSSIRTALVLALLLAGQLAAALPAEAGTEQEAMRTIANISRLIINPAGCNPANVPSDNPPNEAGPWTLTGPVCTSCGGTPNHKLLLRVWNYGWALRTPGADLTFHRKELLDFVNKQQMQIGPGDGPWGHYAVNANGNEELTSSHYQLWAAGLAASYLFAVSGAQNGPLPTNPHLTTPTAEIPVRDAVRRWWADEQELYDQIHTNLLIDAPGARFGSPSTGSNKMRDDVYRLLMGLNPKKGFDCTAHKSNTSIFVLQALKAKGVPRLGQPVPGQTPRARLMDTLCVYRLGDDWTVYFPVMRSVTDPLYWVQFRGGVRTVAQLGHNPPKPAPYPGGASVLPIPGVVPPVENCPVPEALNQ